MHMTTSSHAEKVFDKEREKKIAELQVLAVYLLQDKVSRVLKTVA